MEVVVLGCRKFGRVHLRALSALKVQFSVMERDPRVREECSSLFHPIKTFSSIEEALSSLTLTWWTWCSLTISTGR